MALTVQTAGVWEITLSPIARSGSLRALELPCSVKASENLNGPAPLNEGSFGTKILVSTLTTSGSNDISLIAGSFFSGNVSDDRDVKSKLTIVGAAFAVAVSISIFSIFSCTKGAGTNTGAGAGAGAGEKRGAGAGAGA